MLSGERGNHSFSALFLFLALSNLCTLSSQSGSSEVNSSLSAMIRKGSHDILVDENSLVESFIFMAMKAIKIVFFLFLNLSNLADTVAQQHSRPWMLLTKKTAESAFYDQFHYLSEHIYSASRSGRIKTYRDSMFREAIQLEELKMLTTTVESWQIINPLNPNDPYDIIDTVVNIYYDPYDVQSIENKGDVVFYRFFTNQDVELFFKKQDVLAILPSFEEWLFHIADSMTLTKMSVRMIVIETFGQIEKAIYKSIESDKIIKFRTDSLSLRFSNEEASKIGSLTEYTSRWKDTSNAETKRTIRRIDSLRAIYGTRVSIPFDSSLAVMETIIHPFNPEKGLRGIRLSLESSMESLSFSYSVVAIAPTYQPIASGIDRPGGIPIFWLKREDALALLSKEQKMVFEMISDLGLKLALDPFFDSLYDEEEW